MVWDWHWCKWLLFLLTTGLGFYPLVLFLRELWRQRRAAELARLEALDWTGGPLAVQNRERFWTRFPCEDDRYVYIKAQVGADRLPLPSPSQWAVRIIVTGYRLGRPVTAPHLRLLPGRGVGSMHLVYADEGHQVARDAQAQQQKTHS